MRRILLIAKRDYLQTVLSKAYLVGLVLLPLLAGGGFLVTSQMSKGNGKDERIAVLDRTGVAGSTIIQACEESNRKTMFDERTGLQVMPRYVFELVKPEPDALAQLLALSERVRTRELVLVLEIGPDALRPAAGSTGEAVRYYTNSTVPQLEIWLNNAVNDGLRRVRLAQLNVDSGAIPDALRTLRPIAMELVTRDGETGDILPASKRDLLRNVIPLFMAVVLMMVVITGSAPLMGTVAEDKMQKVFEMMLTSASPFELMAGKVLAGLGASLTSSLFYVAGGLLALSAMALLGFAPLHLLPWFFIYLIANVTMLAATSIALGSACSTPQDAQSLAFLLFMPIFVPMLVLPAVIQSPHGGLATVMSLIPPFAPVLMLIRQGLPGGVPWWQVMLGLVGMSLWAAFLVWAGARIFRIGILSQGNTPKLSELARWVARG